MVSSDSTDNRSRTFCWEDPAISARAAQKMSGIEFLQAIQNGDLPAPPIAKMIGSELLEIEEGRALFGIQPDESHYNPIGTVHGGIASTILDSALACAIQSKLPTGQIYTTIQLNINLIRPITSETGYLHCEGKAIHVGRKLATAEARLTDANGKLYAHASTSCMVISKDNY